MPKRFDPSIQSLITSLTGLCLVLVLTVSQAAYTVQAGAFANSERAARFAAQLRDDGFPRATQVNQSGSSHLTRVLVGPYPDRAAAGVAQKHLKAVDDIEGFLIGQRSSHSANEIRSSEPFDTARHTRALARPPVLMAQAGPEEPTGIGQSLASDAQTQRLTETEPKAAEKAYPSTDDPFGTDDSEPASMDELFGTGETEEKPGLSGFFRSKFAYTYKSPSHASLFRNLLQLGSDGRFNADISWKLSARGAYDAVFDLTDHYSSQVEHNRQWEGEVYETYVDASAGDWDFRLGRQNIIWGEMVGLFFADVVSAKDTRQWVAEDFEFIRIPQWAVRAENFSGDFHTEAIWIPFPTYDKSGKPGDDFYPIQETSINGLPLRYKSEEKPTRDPSNSAYGLRASVLKDGWDISGFYYRSVDQQPAFFREVTGGPNPEIILTPEHKKIHQAGATLAKDFRLVLLKAEAVFTKDRRYAVDNLNDNDGVVKQNTLDYVVGLERTLRDGTLVNFQAFQRWYTDHDSDILYDKFENGVSLFAQKDLNSRTTAEFLAISSLNRPDWMVRPRVTWDLTGHWQMAVGSDIFGGKSKGLIGGRYEDSSRIYAQARYTF